MESLGVSGDVTRALPLTVRVPPTPMTAPRSHAATIPWSNWTQGLWTCALGIPATPVCLAHKVATTVCPPPRSDTSYVDFVPIDDTDMNTTAGWHSAGAQIDLAVVVPLYVRKC